MSDDVHGDSPQAPPAVAATAGAMLRQARQARGLHIAALAAAIKVVPRKLELLESDQFDQLPGATFTRALAQTVCRTLKIDAAPILALMPPPQGAHLENVSQGLNAPFRERPGRLVPKEWASLTSPALWLAVALLLAALAMYFAPQGWLPFAKSVVSSATDERPAAVAPVVNPAVAPTQAPASPAASVAVTPQDLMPPPVAPEAVVPAASMLQLRASAESWVEVTDARGQTLISRVVLPGEDVSLDGVMPFKIKIGNAGATQLALRGQPVDLAAYTRDNVARLELK